MKAQQLDFTALSVPVSAVKDSATTSFWVFAWLARRLSIWIILTLILGPYIVFAVFVNIFHPSDSWQAALYYIALLCAGFFLGVAVSWRKLYNTASSAGLKRFAETNGFTYLAMIAEPALKGMLFDNGSERQAYNIVEGNFNQTQFEVGNYSFVARQANGKIRKEDYGYAWMALPRHLPHMVLDSKEDNFLGLTSMPDDFARDQLLQLEGDFNKYFDLYCPKEYERDALYIFTPDLMALLIDHGHHFDLEVVENKLYLYNYGGFDFTQAEHLELVFNVIEIVGKSMVKRSGKYADARVGSRAANIIAPSGRRLKPGYLTFLIVILLGLMVFIVQVWLELGF